MSETLQKSIKLLEVISAVKKKSLREQILKDLSKNDELFDAISEISKNTVTGRLKLTEKQKSVLKKYKKVLIEMAMKPKGKRKRKKLIVQTGGFLPILIPTIATLLAVILTRK